MSVQNTFYVSAAAGAVGAIITIIFLPETTGLDLAELDRFSMYLLAGQEGNYHGEAVNPKHLSRFERWLGWGKGYDPEADKEQATLQAFAVPKRMESLKEEQEEVVDEMNDKKTE